MEYKLMTYDERHRMVCALAEVQVKNRPDLKEDWQIMAAWNDAYDDYTVKTDSEVYMEYHKQILVKYEFL